MSNNNACPVCGNKTQGKAVRRVNFCKVHRDLAIFLRDNEEVKKHERNLGESLWGSDFLSMISSFARDANILLDKKGCKLVGT